MKNKMIYSIMLMLFMVLSTAGAISAVDPLTLTVTFDKKTADVGDNVTVTIVQKNNGIYDSFKNLKLLVTIKGNGIELDKSAYLLNPSGSGGNNNFTAATGIWQSQNLKKGSSGGGMKTLIIYITIPSELEGKTITANAHYISVNPDPVIDGMTFTAPEDVSDTLTVKKNTTGTGNSTGTGNTTSITNTKSTKKKTNLTNALKNVTKSQGGIESIQSLNPPAQGNSYEITNATTSRSSDDGKTIYAILGGLIIVILIVVGYFKGLIG
ncbi:MAG: hypothetical protein QMD61_09565 [Methanobacterium sp.]|nr:hypothetical protein [Methanobacterium sp.]